MNNKMNIFIYTVLLGSVLISSCASPELEDPIPINEEYVNHQILLRAPAFINKFSTSDVVILDLLYNSTNEIVFPNNYGLRIFERTVDGWMEIKEIPTETFPSDDIILSPLKEMPAIHAVMFIPDLPDLGRKYSLRIYVIGQMNSSGQTIEVIAYTDVVLKP